MIVCFVTFFKFNSIQSPGFWILMNFFREIVQDNYSHSGFFQHLVFFCVWNWCRRIGIQWTFWRRSTSEDGGRPVLHFQSHRRDESSIKTCFYWEKFQSQTSIVWFFFFWQSFGFKESLFCSCSYSDEWRHRSEIQAIHRVICDVTVLKHLEKRSP